MLDNWSSQRWCFIPEKSWGQSGWSISPVMLKSTLLPAVFDVSGLCQDSGVLALFEFLKLDLGTTATGCYFRTETDACVMILINSNISP